MSVGMRLPEAQKEFHAGAEESISVFFFPLIISSHLLPSPLKYVRNMQTQSLAKGRTQRLRLQAPPPPPLVVTLLFLFNSSAPFSPLSTAH